MVALCSYKHAQPKNIMFALLDQSLVWFGFVCFVVMILQVVEMFVAVASLTKARKREFPFVQGGFLCDRIDMEKERCLICIDKSRIVFGCSSGA